MKRYVQAVVWGRLVLAMFPPTARPPEYLLKGLWWVRRGVVKAKKK